MAFVILHPQHAAQWSGRHHEFAEELKEHVKSRLPGFARPEWVEIVPELPVSRTILSPSQVLKRV
jgi:acyl-coenzyme A synthetase/AMP-(fatty) acid ligase